MTQLFIKAATPSVEIHVTAADASGTSDSILVGYKRHKAQEGARLLKEWESRTENLQDLSAIYESTDLRETIRDSILYLKSVTLVDADGKVALKIADTRSAKDNPTAWGDASNCLSWLLEMLLDSSPWWSALSHGLLQSYINSDRDFSKNS